MISRDRSFPHPVLAPFRDDVMPNDCTLDVEVTTDADGFYLEMSLDYSSPAFSSLVESGQAIHSFHVECKRNFYRRVHSAREKRLRVTIPATELLGRVEVSAFITARLPLPAYSIEGAHPDYEGTSFEIERGDVLAVAQTVVFDAYQDYDPLSNIASILTVQRSEDRDEGPIEIDTSGDKIVVTLAKADYDRYVELKADPALGSLLANQLVIPAVLEGLYEIRQASEDELEFEMGKRWFRSIAVKLEEIGMDLRRPDVTPFGAAQALLQLPLRRSLESLLRITAPDGDE